MIFALLVGSLMMPNAVVLVPQYILTQQLGWLSTYQGLIVPEAAMTFAFGVFLLRQFFLTLPAELEDAARIDGASPWHIFTRIVLPLSQPVLAALSIFAFRSAWNDFLWPLIAVNKPDMFPLPVALALLRSAYSSESYGPIMAGATPERAAASHRVPPRQPPHHRGRAGGRPQELTSRSTSHTRPKAATPREAARTMRGSQAEPRIQRSSGRMQHDHEGLPGLHAQIEAEEGEGETSRGQLEGLDG